MPDARSSSIGRPDDRHERFETAVEPNMPNLQNVPNMPNVPNLPNLPNLPSMRSASTGGPAEAIVAEEPIAFHGDVPGDGRIDARRDDRADIDQEDETTDGSDEDPSPDRQPIPGPWPRERLLITGIAGGQGRLLARRIRDRFDIIGVDRVPWERHPRHVRMHVLDLRRRKLEDLFRTERPTAVVHLAFVRHFDANPRLRHEVNVSGTRQLLDYCASYGVRRLVVLSSSYVYGALADNPCYMTEDAPLNVSRTYPEVRDLAEVDALCGAFLWRYPHIKTSILRPVNTLGNSVHSAVARYLKLAYVPTILGFDPMLQFIHEEDLSEAVAVTLEKGIHGFFNVTGSGAVPLKVAIRASGSRPIAIPESVARVVIGNLFRLGLFPFPPGAIDFVKYPCTVEGSRFRAATGFSPMLTLRDIFATARR
jgi:UDP-glucose 4-epimerase